MGNKVNRGHGNSKLIEDTDRDILEITHEGEMTTRAAEDSMFSDLITVERTNLIELKSNVNVISNLRDITVETDSTISATGGEYSLATNATASAVARLDSAEIGRYQPGFAAETGVGVRCVDTLTGDMEERWGYYDDNNGFFFGRDATGVFISYRREGDGDTKVYQENWNGDVMDGGNTDSNPSGYTLNALNGNIYQIRFTWYGYGVIEWNVVTQDPFTKKQRTITVHRFKPSSANSTTNPNLPIRVEVLNGTTATAHTVYVGGRQFSILGRYNPRRRVTSQYRLSLGSIGTTFLPTVSFRRKSTYTSTSVKVEGFDLITDQDLLVQVRVKSNLTGASYATPTDHTAQETAVEADTSATAISGGEVIYETLISASGAGANSKGSASQPLVPSDLINTDNVTLCIRRLTGTGATASVVFRVTEEW